MKAWALKMARRTYLWLLAAIGNPLMRLVESRFLESRRERAERERLERGTDAGDIINGVDLERVGLIVEGQISRFLGGDPASVSDIEVMTASGAEKWVAERVGREAVEMVRHGCRADQVARHVRRRSIACARELSLPAKEAS